ncbi:MAG: hypothetical protein UZ01_02073 [Candidatus Brocadia sinica]|nr:MAG: hypothetical protein UZ01_02073 [Candidatus Brocadia sinica]
MNSKQKGKIHRIEQICCSETSCHPSSLGFSAGTWRGAKKPGNS